jgi:hypothetical protein
MLLLFEDIEQSINNEEDHTAGEPVEEEEAVRQRDAIIADAAGLADSVSLVFSVSGLYIIFYKKFQANFQTI